VSPSAPEEDLRFESSADPRPASITPTAQLHLSINFLFNTLEYKKGTTRSMDSSTPEAGAPKRKRSPVEEATSRPPPPPPSTAAHPGNVTQINYLVRAKPGRLRLIEGDSEMFGDILGTIDEYEGWSRNS
jgi:hypothetical protein